jgi:hypothetical protein
VREGREERGAGREGVSERGQGGQGGGRERGQEGRGREEAAGVSLVDLFFFHENECLVPILSQPRGFFWYCS